MANEGIGHWTGFCIWKASFWESALLPLGIYKPNQPQEGQSFRWQQGFKCPKHQIWKLENMVNTAVSSNPWYHFLWFLFPEIQHSLEADDPPSDVQSKGQ